MNKLNHANFECLEPEVTDVEVKSVPTKVPANASDLKQLLTILDRVELAHSLQTAQLNTLQERHLLTAYENAQLELRLDRFQKKIAQLEYEKSHTDEKLRKAEIKAGIYERSNSCNELALSAACEANKELELHLAKVEAIQQSLLAKYDVQQAHLSKAEDDIYQLTEDKFVLTQQKSAAEEKNSQLMERLR